MDNRIVYEEEKEIMLKVVFGSFILGLACSISALFNPTNKILYNGDVMKNSSLGSGEIEEEQSVIVRYDLNYDSLNIPKVLGFEWNGDLLNRSQKRQNGRNFHYQRNQMILNNLNLDNERVYISKYFPCIEVYYTTEEWQTECIEVYSLATSNYLESINVISSSKSMDHLYSALYYSGAADMVFEGGIYKGSGVKVGLLETGIVDASSVGLADANLVVRDEWFYIETVSSHATEMATIIGGTGGIAPQCTIYSVEAFGGLSGEIDWLLDKDIDICNMSFGYEASKGTYKASQTALIDYAANNYDIIFFAATGNEGTDGVSNPALGYNVIGVGTCDFEADVMDYSAYIEGDSAPDKPNICVLGTSVGISSLGVTISGTSVSCAIMSGLCALMVQEHNILRERPALAIATIMMAGQSPRDGDFFSDELGAGLFRYDYWRDFYGNNVYYSIDPSGNYTVEEIEDVRLEAGEKIKVAIAWEAISTSTSKAPKHNDYELYFYDPNGNLIVSSTQKNSNYEVIEYTATQSGQHSIKIVSASVAVSNVIDNVAMCYRIEF